MGSAEGTPEPRQCPRFPVRGWYAWIEWRNGDRGCETLAEVINISLGGALTLTAASLRVGQHVMLRIEGIRPRVWIPATVVAIREGRLGHQVHLEFRTPCPALVLDAVIADRSPDGPWLGPKPPPAPGLAWYEAAVEQPFGREGGGDERAPRTR